MELVDEPHDSGSITPSCLNTIPSGSGNQGQVMLMMENAISEQALSAVDPSKLKDDQFQAYNIITWHLKQNLAGKNPPPLRMIVHGKGGMGKSKVIQTVTEQFVKCGAKYLLLKAAYTGVTASLIDGKTTHVIGMISTSGKPMSDEPKAKLRIFWKHFVYLIIDEISMISKSFLAVLSWHIGIGKEKSGGPKISDSLGGMNVIFFGIMDSQLRHANYEEFNTVVILREQLWVTDSVWHDFLTYLHYGHVKECHLALLREQIIRHPGSPSTDFNSAPWNAASLVTPRHSVQQQWNKAALWKHCRKTNRQLFICPAEDRINN